MDIQELEHYIALRCVPNYDYGLFIRFLVICHFFPLYLTFGFYGVMLVKRGELYYKFFSLGLTLNWLLNWALQEIIKTEPHVQGCGEDFSMPSWHAQQASFFHTMVMTFLLFKKRRLETFTLVMLNALPAFVYASSMVLGFNTFSEIIIGSIVGLAFAIIYQFFLFVIVQPRIPWILSFSISKYFGYTDHMFDPKKNDDAPQEPQKEKTMSETISDLVTVISEDPECELCIKGIPHDGIHF